jgi:hypothetical protein
MLLFSGDTIHVIPYLILYPYGLSPIASGYFDNLQ